MSNYSIVDSVEALEAKLAEVREALMQIRIFPEKVIKYLWDDAFKFCREKVFNNYTNLESLTRDFKGDKEFSVFKDLFSETEN